MIIGVDARPLTNQPSGIGMYLREILKYINENDNQNIYYLYSNKEVILPFEPNSKFVIKRFKSRVSTLGLYFRLPKMLREDNVEVFWGTQHILPRRTKGVKYVLTVHDLALLINPAWGSYVNSFMQNVFLRASVKAADKIIAVTNSTKDDIIKICHENEDKVDVVYEGAPSCKKLEYNKEDVNRIIEHLGIKQQFFLYLGTIEPRKNIINIIKAFEVFTDQNKSANYQLVLAGGLGWKYKPILRTIDKSRYKDRIILTGYVSSEEKEALLAKTTAFLFPSNYEGFGIPILEAMSHGIPVITTGNSSLPEVAGDAGLYVNKPNDIVGMAGLMNDIVNFDDNKREEIRGKCLDQSSKFSWDDCGRKTHEIILKSSDINRMDVSKKNQNIYEKSIMFLLYWTVFQDIFLGMFYNYVGSSVITKLLFYSKDALFVILFLFSVIRNYKKYKKFYFLLLMYFLLIFAYSIIPVFTGRISLFVAMQNIRNFILFPCLFSIGIGIKGKIRFINSIINKFFSFLIFAAAVGIIECFLDAVFSTKGFWLDIVQIGQFMADIKGQAGRLYNGLPGNFYGSYGKGYFAQKRLVSFWGGPLTAAYVLLLPTIYYLLDFINSIRLKKYRYNIKAGVSFIIGSCAIWMTYTRAIILPLLIVLICIVWNYIIKPRKCGKYFIIGGIILFIFVCMLKYTTIKNYLYDGSTLGHILSISGSISHMSILGHGIGSFGIGGSIGTESSFLSLWGQLGILGPIIYLLLWVIPIANYWEKYKQDKSNIFLSFVLISSIIYLGTGFISEQLFAYTTMAPFYVIFGCGIAKEDY